MRPLRLVGERFGRLTVVEQVLPSLGITKWRVRCDCGNERICRGTALTSGHSKSCGCAMMDAVTIHGRTRTAEFRAWQNMIERCTNPKAPKFKNYGGRGIAVCEKWKNRFEAFLADVGERPAPHLTIDRIDNNGNYEPGNVRWTTYSEQNKNRRSNGMLGKKIRRKA